MVTFPNLCFLQLLSFGEKPRVFVSQVVVHVRPSLAKPPASSAAPGPRVDLERVHSLLAAMGSTLSPGAQQLMSMVRFQQQVRFPPCVKKAIVNMPVQLSWVCWYRLGIPWPP